MRAPTLPTLVLPGPPGVQHGGLRDALTAAGRATLADPRALASGGGAVHLVAASTATPTALALAASHPERVASLVVAGGWSRTDRPLRALLQAWEAVAARAGALEELLAVVAATAFGRSAFLDGTADDRLAAWAALGVRDPGALRAARELLRRQVRAALAPDAGDAAAHVRVPVLLLAGAEDGVAGARHARRLAAQLAHAELEEVAGAGHALLEEDPRAAAARLGAFHAAAEGAAARPARRARA